MDRRSRVLVRRSASRAFTLVELLIVVAILAVCVAVMTPLFMRAKAEEKGSQCLLNLQNIVGGLVMYTNDCDDTLPMAYYDSSKRKRESGFESPGVSGSTAPIWADLTMPYTGGRELWRCPVDDSAATAGATKLNSKLPLSYGLNAYFYDQPGVRRETESGGSLGEVDNVKSKILVGESISGVGRELISPSQWQQKDGSATWERHLQGANWALGDMHVAFHRMPQAWKSVSAATWLDPKLAAKEPYPQWFPWIDTAKQQW